MWSSVVLDTIDFHCMDKKVQMFFKISYFVFHSKHAGIELYEGGRDWEKMLGEVTGES